jgi:hypothetical protein
VLCCDACLPRTPWRTLLVCVCVAAPLVHRIIHHSATISHCTHFIHSFIDSSIHLFICSSTLWDFIYRRLLHHLRLISYTRSRPSKCLTATSCSTDGESRGGPATSARLHVPRTRGPMRLDRTPPTLSTVLPPSPDELFEFYQSHSWPQLQSTIIQRILQHIHIALVERAGADGKVEELARWKSLQADYVGRWLTLSQLWQS